MRRVQTNAELEALYAVGVGFIFNAFTLGPSGARDNVLHVADCDWVRRMLAGSDPRKPPTVPKVFFAALDEALSWLHANRGAEGTAWKQCSRCSPGRRTADAASTAGLPVSGRARSAKDQSSRARLARSPRFLPPPALFAMPDSPPIKLPVPPRLASWNKATDPDQIRLRAYLDEVEELLRPRYEHLVGPMALRLDVGLPRATDLLHERDLDNYFLPLAARLGRSAPGTLVCAWGTKRHAESSYVRVEPALPASGDDLTVCHAIRTNESAGSIAFKMEVSDQLGDIMPLPPGPVRLQLSFAVGRSRNWINLWKPTIDALGKILGQSPGRGAWNPLDGRVTDLGLHCTIDPDLDNDTIIAVAADNVRAPASEHW